MLTEAEIQILPDFIANQIAAGEVVQRPESIVKELVENSLDAGADTIVVVVRGAGKQLIHIVDNGKGMSHADLLLACKRHATSKIKTAQDLERISTLGFRGEALASIASVAQMEIRTRREKDEIGWKLASNPLVEPLVEPFHVEKGTQIFVRNLFYNVPARRKFLRSDLTEFRHISDTMLKFALGNPGVRFVFYDDDSLIYDVKPAEERTRIADLFGNRFAESLLAVEFQGEYISVHGFVGQPAFAKQSKSESYLYLNGRSIANRQLNHAVISSYEHLIDKNSYPPYILFLNIDASKVDVNVHPQKHEVKFDDDRIVYNALREAVSGTLRGYDITPEVSFREQKEGVDSQFEKIRFSDPSKPSDLALVNRLTGEIIEQNPNFSQNFGNRANFDSGKFDLVRKDDSGKSFSSSNSGFPPARQINQREMTAFEALFGGNNLFENEKTTAAVERALPKKFFWQLHRKYILTQSDKGLVIIDQHNAHERILYERALKAMNDAFPYSQELLYPVQLQLSSSDIALVQELSQELHDLGYDLKFNEGFSVEIRGVPLDVRSGNEEESLREILAQYREYEQIRHTDKRDNLAASFGCKAAIKTGETMSIPEMQKLVEDLYATSMPYVCQHGRPIVVEYPLAELDRRFGRTS